RNQTTLLIDTSNILAEDAELFLSSVMMNLILEEDLETPEQIEIVLLGKLNLMKWKVLLKKVNGRILLRHENQQAIAPISHFLPLY
ncbi:MAG TPA: hypothetical protein V6C58_22880, partial [Allocoleopsis sp.]